MKTKLIANGNADKQLKGKSRSDLPTGSRKMDFRLLLPDNTQIPRSGCNFLGRRVAKVPVCKSVEEISEIEIGICPTKRHYTIQIQGIITPKGSSAE